MDASSTSAYPSSKERLRKVHRHSIFIIRTCQHPGSDFRWSYLVEHDLAMSLFVKVNNLSDISESLRADLEIVIRVTA